MSTKRVMQTHVQGMEGEKFLRLLELCDRVSDVNKRAMIKHYIDGEAKANIIEAGLITSTNWSRVVQTIERKRLQIEAYITSK